MMESGGVHPSLGALVKCTPVFDLLSQISFAHDGSLGSQCPF